MAGGRRLHAVQVVFTIYLLGKKLGWRAGECWACVWVRKYNKNLIKVDDISDLMNKKNKDNFQIPEKYVAI